MSDVTKWLKSRTIFEYIGGSHSYGLNRKGSDVDYRGIAIPPVEYFYGLKTFDQYEGGQVGKEDSVIYGIKKFFKLAADCNPNIIEFLFCDRSHITYTTPVWEKIRANRDLFISKKAKFTFSGYAVSQLNRIKGHRKYLMDPPEKKPEREDFGLPTMQKINFEVIGAYNSLNNDGFRFDKDIMSLFTRENQYQAEKRKWDSYQTWIEHRNLSRMKLEADYGYDTKHAMHLVRLLNMGVEILRDGEVNVLRPDRDLLLYVRDGGWTYDELIYYAEGMERQLDVLYEESTLPKKPDLNAIEDLLITSIKTFNKEG